MRRDCRHGVAVVGGRGRGVVVVIIPRALGRTQLTRFERGTRTANKKKEAREDGTLLFDGDEGTPDSFPALPSQQLVVGGDCLLARSLVRWLARCGRAAGWLAVGCMGRQMFSWGVAAIDSHEGLLEGRLGACYPTMHYSLQNGDEARSERPWQNLFRFVEALRRA